MLVCKVLTKFMTSRTSPIFFRIMFKLGKLFVCDFIVDWVHFVTIFLLSFCSKTVRDTALQIRPRFSWRTLYVPLIESYTIHRTQYFFNLLQVTHSKLQGHVIQQVALDQQTLCWASIENIHWMIKCLRFSDNLQWRAHLRSGPNFLPPTSDLLASVKF